jgi:hypothetical protein
MLRLLREAPDGGPPLGGHPVPHRDGGRPRPHGGIPAAVAEALTPLPGGVEELRERYARIGPLDRFGHLIHTAVTRLPLDAYDPAAVRALGRQLALRGESVAVVSTGIALLARAGEPGDVPLLRALGLYRELARSAVAALDRIDGGTAATVWLVVRHGGSLPEDLLRAAWDGDRDAVRAALTTLPDLHPSVWGETALRLTEAADVAGLLAADPDDPDVLHATARLLARAGAAHEPPAWDGTVRLHATVVTRARLLTPDLDTFATLLTLAQHLHSGPVLLADWPPGEREALLEALGRELDRPRWTSLLRRPPADPEERRRIRWILATGRRPFTPPGDRTAFRVEVVVGDPADRRPLETRILVDGRPLVPALFHEGPAHGPDILLEDGGLRAGPEPRTVRLAEADCTESCCGALHVTVRRDGDTVVWDDFRAPGVPPSRAPRELPVLRFDAAAYDAEITRAEADLSWSWPARTTARLIKTGLADEPGLLARWDARPGWIDVDVEDPDTTVITFLHAPGLGRGEPDGILLQFRWALPDDGTPPQERAAAALRRIARENPTRYAQLCGGSPARAAELGFRWPEGR